MKSGLQKIKSDHRDYDFLKSHQHRFAGLTPFPPSFDVDAGLWVPDQETTQAITGIPTIPAMPYGCTDYAQTDLCMDEDEVQLDPMQMENFTHANAQGGLDIRVALKATKTVFNRVDYFNIKPAGFLDAFDACRLAIYSAQPENRAVSVGTIWYPVWEGTDASGIVAMPPELRLDGPWHNYAICGWTTINGILYLKGKSWQGTQFGDKGFHYISREVFNSVMSVSGTAIFTLSKVPPQLIQRVDMGIVATIVSFIRSLLGI